MQTVLIADDHEEAREAVSRWVRRLEPRLHVVQVGDGVAALERGQVEAAREGQEA